MRALRPALLALLSGVAAAALVSPAASAASAIKLDTAGKLDAARLAIRTRQYPDAIKQLESAAAGGNAEARYLLALARANGLGGEMNRDAVLQLLRAAATEKLPPAMFALAGLLASGTEAERAEAAQWVQRAAELNYAPAVAQLKSGSLPLANNRTRTAADAAQRFELAAWAIRHHDASLLQWSQPAGLVSARDAFGRSLLHVAAESGDAPALDALLAGRLPVNVQDRFRTTPLMLVAGRDDAALLQKLLAAGAKPDALDAVGRSALFYAADANKPASVRALMQARAAPNLVDAQNWTALDVAIQGKHAEAAAQLRELGATANLGNNVVLRSTAGLDPTNGGILYKSWAPLLLAVSRNDAGEIRRAITAGAAVQSLTPQGDTALHVAVEYHAAQAATLLLAAGADPLLAGRSGESAAALALRRGDSAMLDLLLGGKAKTLGNVAATGMLAAAVSHGDAVMVRALLARGANANGADSAKSNPLLLAVAAQNEDIVAALLAAGAHMDARDAAARDALWLAAAAGQGALVGRLIAAGATVDTSDRDGVTPLAAAAGSGAVDVVDRLLAAGAKVDRRSNQGDTPLLRAAASGTPETLAHLLQRRSDPNVQNAFGDTPLIVAARRGQKAMCSQLLAAGANKGLRNKTRATAEEVASARGFQDIARLLGG